MIDLIFFPSPPILIFSYLYLFAQPEEEKSMRFSFKCNNPLKREWKSLERHRRRAEAAGDCGTIQKRIKTKTGGQMQEAFSHTYPGIAFPEYSVKPEIQINCHLAFEFPVLCPQPTSKQTQKLPARMSLFHFFLSLQPENLLGSVQSAPSPSRRLWLNQTDLIR